MSSAEAREQCREALFAIMVTRGSVDQMLDAVIPIIERDKANETWEAAARIVSSYRGENFDLREIQAVLRSRIIKAKP